MRRGWIVRRHLALINPMHVNHMVFCAMASRAVHHSSHPEGCADESDEEEDGKNISRSVHVKKVVIQTPLCKSAALAPCSPIR